MSSELHVAFDVTQERINRTGVGRYATELLLRLRETDGLALTGFSAPGIGGRGRLPKLVEITRRDAAYYPVGLGRAARQAGAQVVHCPAPVPLYAPGVPAVITVHDLLWMEMPELFTVPVRAYHRLSLPAIRRASCVLADSHHTRAEVIDRLGVDPGRVRVAWLAADPRFAPRDVDRGWLRERFGVRERYVLAVATREPRKNLATLLAAFERLAARVNDCELVLAGGRGWRSVELERTLSAVGDRVRVLGFVTDDELVSLYAGAACFAFPSLGEGFGLPVLEAMSCGTPVVTSDNTSLAEVAGNAALLIADPRDSEGLEDALARILESPELSRRLTEAGLARSAEFSWERCARETLDVYRAVARAE
ncbi:glycosyltransferase family 4 protein [Candidatus Solirubrobacter pratensis]|uniref:glycosyltransferase family 4 protein n=1 Tax=Candidatus Solirubrobacter pratensis TaxID=1298857 RepID=UPI00042426B1|nr:glycosyltransferase family 1 protein [Candidatus Solirubrobacter pratensis]